MNDFQIEGLAQNLEGFPPFPLPANVPNPGPWQLTDLTADGPSLSPLGSVKAARETDGRDESVRDESVQFVQFGTKQLDFECLQQLETWSGGSLESNNKGKDNGWFEKGVYRRCCFFLHWKSDADSLQSYNVALINTVLVGRLVSWQVQVTSFWRGVFVPPWFFLSEGGCANYSRQASR